MNWASSFYRCSATINGDFKRRLTWGLHVAEAVIATMNLIKSWIIACEKPIVILRMHRFVS